MPEFNLKTVEQMMDELHETIFSPSSLEGLLLVLLVIFLGWKFFKDLHKFVGWLVLTLFLFEIGHAFAFTELGGKAPFLAVIFKYDVFESLAQLFVWAPPVCKAILWLQHFLTLLIGGCIYLIRLFFYKIDTWLGSPLGPTIKGFIDYLGLDHMKEI